MKTPRRCLALFLLSGPLLALSPADAETVAPPQVAYNLAVTTRGINVQTAGYGALFGTVTLACLEPGVSAIVGRDAKNVVVFENVMHAPPQDDVALRPYSRAFSELRRVAWRICAKDQPMAAGNDRSVAQKGTFVRGGFAFPDEIKIEDRLGSIGCEASASDKLGNAQRCRSHALPQPFVSTLSRKTS